MGSRGLEDVGELPDEVGAIRRMIIYKLTWLALDEDHVARSRRVEQLIAL